MPTTPMRYFRMSDRIWDAAKKIADEREETMSEVIRHGLRTYVERYSDDLRAEPEPAPVSS